MDIKVKYASSLRIKMVSEISPQVVGYMVFNCR